MLREATAFIRSMRRRIRPNEPRVKRRREDPSLPPLSHSVAHNRQSSRAVLDSLLSKTHTSDQTGDEDDDQKGGAHQGAAGVAAEAGSISSSTLWVRMRLRSATRIWTLLVAMN
jgi:hypothetical protein